MKKVLIISAFFHPNVGGAETHLTDLCKYLTKNNYYVYVLTYQPLVNPINAPSIEIKKNLEIRRVLWFGRGWFNKLEKYPFLEFLYLFPGLFLATVIFLLRNYKKLDVIHVHGFVPAIIARLVTIIWPLRTVMSVHAIYEFSHRGFLRRVAGWVLEGFDVIFPLARESRKDLSVIGIEEKKIRFYTQWVDQEVFCPKDKILCRRKLGLCQKFTVLFAGRLIAKKGAAVLAMAAKFLPNIQFIILGDGPERENLESIASKNILLAGEKSQEEIALFYQAADLIAVPSLYKEGFARVVLEALSCGRPVIASNRGCLPEMIIDGTGIIIEPTPDNFAKEIKNLQNNTIILEKLSKNALKYAKERFSEKNAREIIKAYDYENI